VLVVISADPDAIASAMAVGRLLWRRVESVTISNVNPIDRPDNLAMIRLLKVPLKPLPELQLERFTKVVIVDSSPATTSSCAISNPMPSLIITRYQSGAPFTDIRPSYGATATLLTEYLRAARIGPSRILATALYHAIKTDTDDFKRQTLNEDLLAFQYLFRHATSPSHGASAKPTCGSTI